MHTHSPPEPGRAPLSRDRVIRAAVAFADEHGVAGLSMRKLATSLGFEVMSLYNHVGNKDELLDLMVDLVAGEIAVPPADTPWKPAARSLATSARDALRRHPWATALWSSRWPGRNRWRTMDELLRVLASAGLPDDLADLGFHAINTHIQGFTQLQLAYASDDRSQDEMHARFDAEVSEAEFPHVVEHLRYHQQGERSLDEFEFVLDLILDGLDRTTAPG